MMMPMMMMRTSLQVQAGTISCCCYAIRKGLIRKARLAYAAHLWGTKHPESALRAAVPTSHILQLSCCVDSSHCTDLAPHTLQHELATQAPDLLCSLLGGGMGTSAEQESDVGRRSRAAKLQATAGNSSSASGGSIEEEEEEEVWIAKPSLTNGGAGVAVLPSRRGIQGLRDILGAQPLLQVTTMAWWHHPLRC
jgi:hypothetical protein